ncbi:hypothetical protein TWF506_009371 [Arthrobotrys conoides]|uniref:Uncharacterized protein n=1 Tax=Arthrobotrys conoides TaxID=74498 RepID=A0AAN8RRH8_9PEZI
MARQNAGFGATSKYTLFSFIIPLILLLLHANTALAQNKTNLKENGPVKVKENLKWKLNCTSVEMQSVIDEAFENVKAMLETVQKPDWGSFAAVEYLGSNYQDTWLTYEPMIRKMLQKAYDWLKRSYWFSGPWVVCLNKETDAKCNRPYRTDQFFMLYEENPGDDYREDRQLLILICPSWFSKPSLKALISQAEYCRKKGNGKRRHREFENRPWDIRYYESREFWLLEAIFHVREIYFNLPTDTVEPGASRGTKYLIHAPPFHDYVKFTYTKYENSMVPVMGAWEAKKLATNGVGRLWENAGPLGNPANYALYILAEYIRKETNEYPYAPSRYETRASWIGNVGLLRMCTREPYHIGIVENPSYKPSEKELAIAPWLFTPQVSPPVG